VKRSATSCGVVTGHDDSVVILVPAVEVRNAEALCLKVRRPGPSAWTSNERRPRLQPPKAAHLHFIPARGLTPWITRLFKVLTAVVLEPHHSIERGSEIGTGTIVIPECSRQISPVSACATLFGRPLVEIVSAPLLSIPPIKPTSMGLSRVLAIVDDPLSRHGPMMTLLQCAGSSLPFGQLQQLG